MSNEVKNPFEFFHDVDGTALNAGQIYVGTAGLDPVNNQINVFADASLTIPVAQPIRTISGFPVNNTTFNPIDLYVAENDWSILVQNKNGAQVYNSLSNNAEGLQANTQTRTEIVTFLQNLSSLPPTGTPFIANGINATGDAPEALYILRDAAHVADNFIRTTISGNNYLELQVPFYKIDARLTGADATGQVDATTQLQAGIDYCRDNQKYLEATGTFRISSTLTVGAGNSWGAEFRPFGSFADGQREGGLIWYGPDGDDTSEITATPMLHFTAANQSLDFGPIMLNNRENKNIGICGIKFNGPLGQQGDHSYIERIECHGMDYGCILGTASLDPSNRDDVLEQSVINVMRFREVKNPFYLDTQSADWLKINHFYAGAYQQGGGGYENGESQYVIRSLASSNGIQFGSILISQQLFIQDDISIIDWREGGLIIGDCSIENGLTTCRALTIENGAGAGRGPIRIGYFSATDFRDTSNISVHVNCPTGIVLQDMHIGGDLEIASSTGFVVGFCAFKYGNYGVIGQGNDNRVALHTMLDASGNGVYSPVSLGGTWRSDTIKGISRVDINGNRQKEFNVTNDLFSSGVLQDVVTFDLPPNTEVDVNAQLEIIWYRGGGSSNGFTGRSIHEFNIHQTAANVVTSASSATAPNAVNYRGSVTSVTAVGSATTGGVNQLTIRASQTNDNAEVSRCRIKLLYTPTETSVTDNILIS